MINRILKYFLKKRNSLPLLWGQKLLSMSSVAMRPLHLNIEVTRRCNLECFFCPSRFTKDVKTDMTMEQFKTIVSKLPGLKVITLLGRGETLMNPDIYKMVEYALSTGREAIDIVTNGTLFTRENISRLKGVSNFTVSVDSCEPDEYKRMRGYDLAKIEQNLKRLHELAFWKPCVTIQMLVTSANMRKMKDMIKWAKDMGASRCSFILMIAFDEELDKNNPQFDKDFGKIVAETIIYAKSLNMEIAIPNPSPSRKNCFEPWRSLRVDINGEIYPCCYIFESDKAWSEYYKGVCLKVDQQNYVMGNIFKDDVTALWNGSAYRALRSKVRVNNRKGMLSADEFSRLRSGCAKNGLKEYNYCDFCLYRWQCAC